jgi:hypothetical protein
MYHDLKQHYWWTKMKIEIARYVARCDTCRRVKAIHMKTAGPLQYLPISWKWEDISMDFIVGLLKGKCALGPFLSILVIECKHKCLNVKIRPWVNKVQITS